VYQCPFGAIVDKSFILDVVRLLKNKETEVYAVIAPAITSQFTYAKYGQVISGLKELGFSQVVEAAMGADLVADAESRELVEHRYLNSSCCPAFVETVEKFFPSLSKNISTSLSPMATIGKFLKERNPNAKVVFVGPCTAKKKEIRKDTVKDYVDCALTFEELQAMLDSRDIDLTTLPESEISHASSFALRFARCGGLTEAVAQGLKEHQDLDFEYKPISCDGIE
jgi:iron only hydrogenase large subunit-like protein